MAAADPPSLHLNRKLSNHAFNNWRFDPHATISSRETSLPGTVQNISTAGISFLQTKTVLTHNYLTATPSGIYAFLQEQNDCLALHRLHQPNAADTSDIKAPRITAALPGQQAGRSRSDLLGPPLPASVAAILDSSAPAARLLVSCGFGDLQLVSQQPNADPDSASVSAVTFPLHPTPPQQAVRPFLVEAAYEHAGQVRCIVSALRSRSSGAPAACDVFAITLQLPTPDAAPAVLDVQHLQTSTMRPHAVVVSPQQDCVLLAVDPAVPGTPGQAEAAGQPPGAEAAASTEDYDANPRTMEAAVANLARFTSEDPVEGEPIIERLADIDDEAASEEEGSLFPEPEVAFALFSMSPESGASSQAGAMELQQMSCAPHRLLGLGSGSGGTTAVLGLTDDVDSAVLRISIVDRAIHVEHLASIPALAYVAAGKTQQRAVLFGSPGDTVAAAIVEAHTYMYLYKDVSLRDTVGSNAIISMDLDQKRRGVLGAQLSADASGHSQVTILTENDVKTYSL